MDLDDLLNCAEEASEQHQCNHLNQPKVLTWLEAQTQKMNVWPADTGSHSSPGAALDDQPLGLLDFPDVYLLAPQHPTGQRAQSGRCFLPRHSLPEIQNPWDQWTPPKAALMPASAAASPSAVQQLWSPTSSKDRPALREDLELAGLLPEAQATQAAQVETFLHHLEVCKEALLAVRRLIGSDFDISKCRSTWSFLLLIEAFCMHRRYPQGYRVSGTCLHTAAARQRNPVPCAVRPPLLAGAVGLSWVAG